MTHRLIKFPPLSPAAGILPSEQIADVLLPFDWHVAQKHLLRRKRKKVLSCQEVAQRLVQQEKEKVNETFGSEN